MHCIVKCVSIITDKIKIKKSDVNVAKNQMSFDPYFHSQNNFWMKGKLYVNILDVA